MSRFTAAATIIACTTLAACETQHLEKDHITKAAVTEVIIDADVGTVNVKGSRDILAKAHVETTWLDPALQPAVTFREEGSKLYVTADCGGAQPCRSEIELTMPASATLRIEGDEVDIAVDGIKGALFASTDTGDITLNDVWGALDLSAKDGDIRGDNLWSTRIVADTVNGEIDLIFFSWLWSLETSTATGDIKLVLPELGYQVLARTADGSVDVRVPKSGHSRRLVKADISEAGNILIVPTDNTGGAM